MTLKVKFLKPWRGYKANDVADLKAEVAEDRVAAGEAEVIEGPPILAPEAPDAAADSGALREANAELRDQLKSLHANYQELQSRYSTARAELAKLKGQPAEPSVDQPPADGELFAELNLSDAIKQKMVAAGWRTVQDVVDFGNANDGLQGAEGIGKATEEAIAEAIKAYQAAN